MHEIEIVSHNKDKTFAHIRVHKERNTVLDGNIEISKADGVIDYATFESHICSIGNIPLDDVTIIINDNLLSLMESK